MKKNNVTYFIDNIAKNGFPESSLFLINQIGDLTKNFSESHLFLLKDDISWKIEEYKLFRELDPNNIEELKNIDNSLIRLNNLNKLLDDIIENATGKKVSFSSSIDEIEINNITISTIENWLFEFKERNIIVEPHYTKLVNALIYYFDNGIFPKLDSEIKVGRVNKKLLGWHLNRIFHSEGKGVEISLLKFAKSNISAFQDVDFNENDIQKSNLYKYFTTKTKGNTGNH